MRIHPEADGAQVVRYFHDLGVRGLDLLIPDAHYGTSPAHVSHCEHAALLNYLMRAFDQWISYQNPEFGIRIFEEFIVGLFGRPSQVDAFGGDLSNALVLESDGSYQFVDVLHTCGEDQVVTPMHVSWHSFEDFHRHAAAVLPKACATCRQCPIFGVCGGGYLPHRFDGKGFDNPSVYCDVLYPLITYIRDYLRSVTPARMWSTSTASGRRSRTRRDSRWRLQLGSNDQRNLIHIESRLGGVIKSAMRRAGWRRSVARRSGVAYTGAGPAHGSVPGRQSAAKLVCHGEGDEHRRRSWCSFDTWPDIS